MLNNLKKSFGEMKEEFCLGKKLAEDRRIMARKHDLDLQKIIDWTNSYDSFRKDITKISVGVSGLFGYAFGNYTTYCPIRLQLYIFDKEVEFVRSGVVGRE